MGAKITVQLFSMWFHAQLLHATTCNTTAHMHQMRPAKFVTIGTGMKYVKPRYLVIGKLEKCGCWIGSRWQDKDQRWQTAAVTEGTWQIERRWFYKLLPNLLHHKFHNRWDNFVWSYCSQYKQPLELAEMFFELFRQLCTMWFLHRINTSLKYCVLIAHGNTT